MGGGITNSTHFCRKERTEKMPTVMIAMQMLDATNAFQLALPGKLANLVTVLSSVNTSKV